MNITPTYIADTTYPPPSTHVAFRGYEPTRQNSGADGSTRAWSSARGAGLRMVAWWESGTWSGRVCAACRRRCPLNIDRSLQPRLAVRPWCHTTVPGAL